MTDLIGGSNLLGNKSGRTGSLLEMVEFAEVRKLPQRYTSGCPTNGKASLLLLAGP